MTRLWKKIMHIFAVLFVATAMVFSFIEPKTMVVAEGEQNNGEPTDPPQATNEPVEATGSAQGTNSAPTEDPESKTYAITIDPVDTEEAYFDENISKLYIRSNATVPFHFTVHDGPDPTAPAIENADVQVDTKNLPVKYDDKNKTLTAENVGYADGDIILKYKNSQRPVRIHVSSGRYGINLSPYFLRMDPQTTSNETIHVSVYDSFKGTTDNNPEYEVSEGANDHVTFDKATGKVTSYDQYGNFNITFTYKDARTTLNVAVVAPVQSLSFTQNEITLKQNAGGISINRYLNVEPREAQQAAFEAVSDNTDVVKVEGYNATNFTLLPVSEGTANVTITSNGISASIKVNVVAPGVAAVIQLNPKYDAMADSTRDIYLKSGETKELNAYLFDENQKDVTESAKDEIVYKFGYKFDQNAEFKLDGNKITATGSGSATVIGSIGDGWRQQVQWNIHVTDKEPESISFGENTYQLNMFSDNKGPVIRRDVYLTAKPNDININDYECSVKSDDESIVKVSGSGARWSLEPVKPGSTTITAKTSNGKTATAKVVVVEGDFASSFSSDSMDKSIPMKPGDTFVLQPVYTLPGGNTTTEKPKDEKVTYNVSEYNKPYVKLTDNGDGTASVKALDFCDNILIEAQLTNGAYTYWRIQIIPDITSMRFTKKEITVTDENQYSQLKQYLDITPYEAYGSELAWSSSDIRTATVDNYGNVHVIKYDGDTTITASSKDGKVKDSILVHCRKAVAPESITTDKGDDIYLYADYATRFQIKKTPEYASSNYKVQIDDPDHVTDLNQENYQTEGNYSGFYVRGKKKGDAKVIITSAKYPSIQKTINIHVLDGKPDEKDFDLDYQIVTGNFGWDSTETYDPSIELFKDSESAIGVLHPKKFTFLKGGNYAILLRYKGDLSPADGFIKDKDGLLNFLGSDASGYPSGYTLETFGFDADKVGTGTLKISDSYSIDYQVVNAVVNEKPEINTGDAKGDLKDEISKITNESIGMDEALSNVAKTLDFASNEKVQKAASDLKDDQELKVEITNVIEYKSVEETETSKKITVNITPKYVVKVIDKKTGKQTGDIIDEGEAEVNQNVTLKVPVGKELNGRTLYIRHIKQNGTSRIYEGTVNENGELVFDNPDGFSTFEITEKDPATVQFGNIGYESLEDALNNGIVQGTVEVRKGYSGSTNVTVNRETEFTLDNQSGLSFNITAGDGYTLTQEGNKYTVVQYQPKDDETNWGDPVFKFTDNGTKAVATRTNLNNKDQSQSANAEVKQTEKIDPTCTEKGRVAYTATVMFGNKTYTDQYVEEIEALSHDLQHVPAVPATKDKEGNIEYWKCTRCGKYFSDANGTNEIDEKSVVLPVSKLSSISWSEEPSTEEKTWVEGTSFHYAGKAVLTYENGETVIIDVTSILFDLDGYNPDQIGEQAITLKLKSDNKYVLNETINVNAKQETGIQVSAKNTNLTIGNNPTKADLKVERLFNNGKTETVSDDLYEFTFEAPSFTEQELLDKSSKKAEAQVTETATGFTASIEFEISPSEYKLKEGDQASIVLENNADYTFSSDASYDTFRAVGVDGKIIDASNYTAKSGSTVITLNASYLQTLSEGKHTIQIVSSDGIAEGTFTISAKKEDQKIDQKNSDQKNNDQKIDNSSSPKNSDKITEKKSDTEKKADQKATGKQKKNNSTTADTSDHSNVNLYGGIFIFSVIIVAAIFLIRKKHA